MAASPLMKTCNKCKQRKPRREFVLGTVHDGRGGSQLDIGAFCETCRETQKTCRKCCETKPITEFTRDSTKNGWCKACHEEVRRNLYQRAAKRTRARAPVNIPIGELWYDQDPKEVARLPGRRRRERLRAAPKERIDRIAIFQRDGWKCGICGGSVQPEDATLDHIVPVSLGGGHTAANLRLAHSICNSRRGDGFRSPMRRPGIAQATADVATGADDA
jgi:hypothetical protein